MMTENVRIDRKKKTSVSKYASNVLKESSVSAISGILATGSIYRKVFKSSIFLLFTITFLYQVITFLTYVFEFPTVVNIDIYRPETFMMPAFTMCNSQNIRRSKYCKKYPDRCTSVNKEFCENHESYCKHSYIMVKEEYAKNYETDINSNEDIVSLGTNASEMFSEKNFEDGEILHRDDNVRRMRVLLRDFSLCVAVNSIVNRPEEPLFLKRSSFEEKLFNRYRLLAIYSHDNDAFDPDILPGIYFSIHSPYESVNPYDTGYFLLPERLYKITISMKEEMLLTSPYKTDCMDYIQNWKLNKNSGPRTQEMCRQKCLVDFVSKCFNCSLPALLYPSDKTEICTDDMNRNNKPMNIECLEIEKENKVKKCVKSCKEECLKIIYRTEIRESRIPRYLQADYINKSRVVVVELDIDDREVMRYVFSPKYQNVEAFSYIGGFIGIWLGVSLVQVSEFFESLFLISRYFFKKKSCKTSTSV